MSRQVTVAPSVAQKIARWHLPDFLLVEVHLRLREHLPHARLHRTRAPFDGMSYDFSIVDPSNRLSEYQFTFLILHSQDEERLIVANGAFIHRTGV